MKQTSPFPRRCFHPTHLLHPAHLILGLFLLAAGTTLPVTAAAIATVESDTQKMSEASETSHAPESTAEDESYKEPDPLASDAIGVPMRVRDFTFPSHLVLAFAPMPAAPLGTGNWAFEVHFSQVNNFQVSPEVEEYLDGSRAEGERRRLDAADIDAILAQPAGSAFYIDGEFSFWDFNIFYALTGLTEDLFNMDNTPDIGLHFSWGFVAAGIEAKHSRSLTVSRPSNTLTNRPRRRHSVAGSPLGSPPTLPQRPPPRSRR